MRPRSLPSASMSDRSGAPRAREQCVSHVASRSTRNYRERMKLIGIGVILLSAAACVDAPAASESSRTQAIGEPGLVQRFVMTDGGASVLLIESPTFPYEAHYFNFFRSVVDGMSVAFGGGWQDPASLTPGPYGDYYAAGYFDYAYGVIPQSEAMAQAPTARVRMTVPVNSDTFFSERCYYDFRVGTSYSCTALDGQTIAIDWTADGPLQTTTGRTEIPMGDDLVFVIEGRSTFANALATGNLLDKTVDASAQSYITTDRGAGAYIELDVLPH